MLHTAVRVGTEVAGALAAGIVATELAPSLHGNEFNECLDTKSACFVSQSGSLTAEFIDIVGELHASSMKKILDMSISRYQERKAVASADIDEFLSNLTNDDPDMNTFPDFFAENEGNFRDMKGQQIPSVNEQYRIIPLAEVAKLNNLFGNTNNNATTSNAQSSSSSWLRPLAGYPSSTHPQQGGGKARRVADILTVMWERDRCAIDLSDNFELQVFDWNYTINATLHVPSQTDTSSMQPDIN